MQEPIEIHVCFRGGEELSAVRGFSSKRRDRVSNSTPCSAHLSVTLASEQVVCLGTGDGIRLGRPHEPDSAAEPLEVAAIPLILGRRSILGWPSGSSIDSQDRLTLRLLTGARDDRTISAGARGRSL